MSNVLKRKSHKFIFTALKPLNSYDFAGNETPIWKVGSTVAIQKIDGVYKVVNIDGNKADYRILASQLRDDTILKLDNQW